MQVTFVVVALAAFFAGASAQNLTACELYCGGMNATCPEVYVAVGGSTGVQVCGALCGLWAPGFSNATSGDSLACRQYHLNVAGQFAAAGNDTLRMVHCSHAGPTGGTAQTGYVCGDIYDLYCDLLVPLPTFALAPLYLCKDHGYSSRNECIADVRTNVPASGEAVSLTVQVQSGDSIECRGSWAAAGASPLNNATVTCPQAYWSGADYKGMEKCSTGCKSFCKAYNNTCGFKSAAGDYSSQADCEAQCALFPVKNNAMRIGSAKAVSSENSVGCRKYHTLVALTADTAALKATHCGHALAVSSVCNVAPGAGSAIAPIMALVAALMAFATRF